MALTHDDVESTVINYFSGHFGMPLNWFSPKTSLSKDLLYLDSLTLVGLGKDLNKFFGNQIDPTWHSIFIEPTEIVDCKTFGDIIELVFKKSSGTT